MKNDLDAKFLLRVFEKVREFGEKKDDKYRLHGITAHTDMDGYTLFVEDPKVKLVFGFHNQYHFDYETNEQFEQFEKKLKEIDSEY